jgi:hypothetical protein
MKKTVSEYEFANHPALQDNFSYLGRIALFYALEQLEDDLDITIEFDPIAIRCEYSEYKNIQEFWKDYDRYTYQCMSDIESETIVIYIQNSEAFIIQQF